MLIRNNISKEALYTMYVTNKETTYAIADKYGYSRVSICNLLNNYGIKSRGNIDAARVRYETHVPITTNFSNVLDGLLLGDGCLRKPANFQAHYYQLSSKCEFIDYVSDIFKQNNYFGHRGYNQEINKNTGKLYDKYYFRSIHSIELREVYDRWYLDGKKHVPTDIKLTPITVLLWYLGDGQKIKNKNAAFLWTCAFIKKDQELLVDAFSKIGIKVSMNKYKKYIILHIGVKNNNFVNFTQYMGLNPVFCYNHKFTDVYKRVC